MKICEIYAGIQGESTYAGLPCVFVRVSGCNLRCLYCDTTYSYQDGREMSRNEIVKDVRRYGIGLVEITGGEPLLQDDFETLVEELLELGYKVLIETNGTLDISGIDRRAIVIMDIKTPGSGAAESVCTANFDLLKKCDELKFVLTGRADYDWAAEVIGKYGLAEKCVVLLSPVYGMLDPEDLAGWIISDRLNVRFNLQLHKYIYSPDRRGV